jgi:hypothetical protein
MIAINLLILIPPFVRAIDDYDIIENQKRSINYLRQNFLTALSMLGCGIFPYVFRQAPAWEIILMSLTTYWLLMDYLLNWFRGKPILQYYGDLTDEKNLSFIEKYVYRKISWRILLVMKIVLFTISLIIYG